MKKKRLIFGLLILIILTVGTIYFWGLYNSDTKGNAPTPEEKKDSITPAPTKEAPVSSGSVTTSSSGVQQTIHNIDSETSGKWGNTMGNICNGGFFASSGDYIYFNFPLTTNSKPFGLVRSMKDGITGLMPLPAYKVRFINISGEWIYFTDNNENLIRMKANGEETNLIQNGVIDNPIVYDNNIYYICNGNLMKKSIDNINTDAVLLKSNVRLFTITDDGKSIIYADIFLQNNNMILHKIGLDNTTETGSFQFPAADFTGTILSHNNYIYLSSVSSQSLDNTSDRKMKIYRINISSRNNKPELYLQTAENMTNINLSGNYLYYLSYNYIENYYKICRKDLDSNSVQQLYTASLDNKEVLAGLSVLNNAVYYWSYSQNDLMLCVYDLDTRTLKRIVSP